MAKISRNAPCPCGSGKKYKKCCLSQDQAEAQLEREEARREWEEEAAQSEESPLDLDILSDLAPKASLADTWDAIEKTVPKAKRKEFAPLFQKLRQFSQLEARQPEIDAAAAKLEDWRDAYGQLLNDPGRLREHVEQLLSEPEFSSFAFTVEELEQAFEAEGAPSACLGGKDVALYADRVIGKLLDDDRRAVLSLELLNLLPEYVAAERYLDACIIQHNFMLISEPVEGQCGSLLFCMFAQALDQWNQARVGEERGLYDAVGLDVDELRGRDPQELESMLDQMMDGGGADALESFLEAHPQLRAQMEADCYASETAAVELLQRKEGRSLLLDHEEMDPWFERFGEAIQAQPEFMETARSGRAPSKTQKQRLFEDVLYPFASDMANEVFTKDRLRRLAADVDGCRARFAPKDNAVVSGLNGAFIAAKAASVPGENHFLTMLCLLSVMTGCRDLEPAE